MHDREPEREHEISSDLPSWEEIKATHEWGAILIGNGASRAVWEGVSYSSLFQTAKNDIEHQRTADDQALFQVFEAENFETILAALSSARKVDAALDRLQVTGRDTRDLPRADGAYGYFRDIAQFAENAPRVPGPDTQSLRVAA